MQVNVSLSIDVPKPVRDRTVLLVSADREWRTGAASALTTAGYRVIATRHPGHALVESTRYGSVDVVVAEGEFARGGLPSRIFEDHPQARVLHFSSRPHTWPDLLDAVSKSLK